jgi:hypothetical protein
VVPQLTARRAAGTYLAAMNRLLLILNIVAAGSILATKSSSLLAAISPYGHQSEAVPAQTAMMAARTVDRPVVPDSATRPLKPPPSIGP